MNGQNKGVTGDEVRIRDACFPKPFSNGLEFNPPVHGTWNIVHIGLQMPEAVQIGKLRQQGMSDEAIAKIIGVKRTTFLSRLKKAKEQLAAEFPDRF